MALLIISTLVKIVVVLGILLGIAPLLVWAERRQSAMVQDRVGPVRAGIPLPRKVADFVQGPMSLGAKVVAYLSIGGAVLSLLAIFFMTWQQSQFHDTVASMHRLHALRASAPAENQAAVQRLWDERLADLDGAYELLGATLTEQGTPLAIELQALRANPSHVNEPSLPAAIDEAFSLPYMVLGWALFAFVVLALAHFAASWLVRHAVDKRGHLTVFGFIHPAVDAVKAIWKEDFTPPNADKFLYSAAPIIATIPAFATFAVIPFGADLLWGPEDEPFKWLFSVIPQGAAIDGRVIPLQVASLNVGILYIFAIAGTGIVGAAVAGYSSDNKYSLLGGLRAASQMVSYEVTLGLTLVGCFMVYGTLLLDDMVLWQQEHMWGFIVQPLALVLFFFCAMAEMKRVPFDAPEGESEIVAGYFLEYAGMKFVMFMMGEFIEHIVAAGIIVTIFFGGYDVPFLHADGFHFDWFGWVVPLPHIAVVLIGVLAFLFKVLLVCLLQLQVRWTLPRFRYDQIMSLCWKIILPLSLANILVTGLVILLLS
jgi:NADH-quinone oxidoreductase subunit H